VFSLESAATFATWAAHNAVKATAMPRQTEIRANRGVIMLVGRSAWKEVTAWALDEM